MREENVVKGNDEFETDIISFVSSWKNYPNSIPNVCNYIHFVVVETDHVLFTSYILSIIIVVKKE